MNINKLVSTLKKRIGLNGILKDIYNDEVLYDSIITTSLRTLNTLHGISLVIPLSRCVMEWTFGAQELMTGHSQHSGIHSLSDRDIIIPKDIKEHLISVNSEIRTVYLSRNNNSYSSRGHIPVLNTGHELHLLHAKKIKAQNIKKPSVKFKAPYGITLSDYGHPHFLPHESGYNLHIQVTHPDNLSTISKGIAGFFEDLCMYDIMVNIYNNELSLLNIDLGNSRVEIGTDRFVSASADRAALLEAFALRASQDDARYF